MNANLLIERSTSICIRLHGDVQGYGVRPTVARLANRYGLFGTVKNCLQGVEILVSGELNLIAAFRENLARQFPDARNDVCHASGLDSFSDFRILESQADGMLHTVIPRDRVVCDVCIRECSTAGHRRFGYPLNSCVRCGPRYSIMIDMPYDRQRTSMAGFQMCDSCRAEYDDPSDRRYHAQANACPTCGPKVWFDKSGLKIASIEAAIEAAADTVRQGGIVAMKGLGGYQLVCDARNETAVHNLRTRKRRLSKPLAVMVDSIEAAHESAEINALEIKALRDASGPIVLVRAITDSSLAPSVLCGLRDVGLMLPTTAMHHLILQRLQIPLVVTSGNIDGEPLEYDESDATTRLAGIADAFLHHNRPIINPIDDSVVRIAAGRLMTVRCARGLAPQPFDLPTDSSVIAVGGLQKSALAVSNGRVVMLGPHVGDLGTLRSRQRFNEHEARISRLVGNRPSTVAIDEHPDASYASQGGLTSGPKTVLVQHHHAHIASAMVEAGWLKRTALGIAFDGMGFGSDKTLWGGEILLAKNTSFHRLGRLRPFCLFGGDAAVKQPWRVAVALLVEAIGPDVTLELLQEKLSKSWNTNQNILRNAVRLVQSKSHSPTTSSIGRLFDGVAALACGIGYIDYEGEAAMRFESLITPDDSCSPLPLREETELSGEETNRRAYSYSISDDEPFEVEWRPMIQELVADLTQNVSVQSIASKFHQALAEIVAEIGRRFPDLPMVLTGGVFQNRILVEWVVELLRLQSTEFFVPSRVPLNDGGLALGQLAIAYDDKGAVCA